MSELKVEKENDFYAETIINSMPHLVDALPKIDEPDMNILLVDDDDIAVENVLRSMKKLGINFPVVVADDGQDALDILHDKHPEKKIKSPYVVLLDLNMPRMNGFEFLETIRDDSELQSIAVFVLTTSDSNVDRAKAYKENIAGYMVKDTTTIFNWLFSLLPKYINFVNLLNLSKQNHPSSDNS